MVTTVSTTTVTTVTAIAAMGLTAALSVAATILLIFFCPPKSLWLPGDLELQYVYRGFSA